VGRWKELGKQRLLRIADYFKVRREEEGGGRGGGRRKKKNC